MLTVDQLPTDAELVEFEACLKKYGFRSWIRSTALALIDAALTLRRISAAPCQGEQVAFDSFVDVRQIVETCYTRRAPCRRSASVEACWPCRLTGGLSIPRAPADLVKFPRGFIRRRWLLIHTLNFEAPPTWRLYGRGDR